MRSAERRAPPARRISGLHVEAIAAGGDGVARSEGLVVFVPRTAPDDVVTVDLVAPRARFARARLRDVVRPSGTRVEPPCLHYTRDRCGGCQVQHLAYGAQLDAKRRIVADAFARIAHRTVDVDPAVPSPAEWRYRSKLTLALRRRGGGWIAGLHPYDDPVRVFPLADCPITDRRVVAAWRELLTASALLPDAPSLRGSVRWTDDGSVFTLLGGRRWPTADAFFAAVPTLAALYWDPDPGAGDRQLVADRRPAAASPAASFAQVNRPLAAALRAHVCAVLDAAHPGTVIDAYAGTGELATELAARGVTVTAIELDGDASAWCAGQLPAPSRAIAARVEDVLPSLLPADAVVLNPPRAGLDERVPAALVASVVPLVVYVSCDPATLARDVGRLTGYRVVAARPFDMFPQTAHVETVCVLAPEGA